MQKMVKLSGSLGVGRRVQGKEAKGYAKVRVEKRKVREDRRKEEERSKAREKRSLSARSSEKASVQRQGANEIVGYVLSTTA